MDNKDSTATDAVLPLPVLVEHHYQQQQQQDDGFHYHADDDGHNHHREEGWTVHQRLVTPHPLLHVVDNNNTSRSTTAASIETVWESRLPSVRDGNHPTRQQRRQHRIAIYAGPDDSINPRNSSSRFHVSFQLPEHAELPSLLVGSNGQQTSSNVLAWTRFPDDEQTGKKKYPVLACLVNPHSLTLWDVYPDNTAPSSLPTEGWTIALPFACRFIQALPPDSGGGGLLLQRREDAEDYNSGTTGIRMDVDDVPNNNNNGGFVVLQEMPPPTTRRQRLQSSTAANIQQPQQQPTPYQEQQNKNQTLGGGGGVSSLFSLHHPLEDVLPVTQLLSDHPTLSSATTSASSPQQGVLVTDVREQVVWVGQTEWYDDDCSNSRSSTTSLLVTYHTQQKRHAVWEIAAAPEPPQPPPLYQQNREKYSNVGLGSSMINMDADLSTFRDMLGQDVDVDDDEEDFPMDDHEAARRRRRIRQSQQPHPKTTSRAEALADALGVGPRRTSPRSRKSLGNLPSPRGGAAVDTAAASQQQLYSPSHQNPLDVSHNTAAAAGAVQNKSSSQYAFSSNGNSTNPKQKSLHAKVSLKKLFMEQPGAAAQAARSVFLASNYQATGTRVLALLGVQELKLFALRPNNNTVERLDVIPCRSALPIQAIPAPPAPAGGRRKNTLYATDILILLHDGKMVLYRANHPIVRLNVSEMQEKVLGLCHPVKDRLTLVLPEGRTIRTALNLSLLAYPSGLLAEQLLSTLDAGLFTGAAASVNTQPMFLALKVRADCCRLVTSDSGCDALEVVLVVLMSLIHHEMGCSRVNKPDTGATSDWQALMESDFCRSYEKENAFFLFDDSAPSRKKSQQTSLHDKLSAMRSLSVDFLQENGSITKGTFHYVFDATHLVYENLKLSMSSMGEKMEQLAEILVELCQTFQTVVSSESPTVQIFLKEYRCDIGERAFQDAADAVQLQTSAGVVASNYSFTSFTSPPFILRWVERVLRRRAIEPFVTSSTGDAIVAACSKLRLTLRIFGHLLDDGHAQQQNIQIVSTLLNEGFVDSTSIRDELAPCIALPIMEVLHRCRDSLKLSRFTGWSEAAWRLVGRQDLAKNNTTNFSKDLLPTGAHFKDIARGSSSAGAFEEDNERKDGLAALERTSAMLFPEDNRVHEAARLLRSSHPIFLRVARSVEISDHDYERLKQKRLLELSIRSLALPVGRGMLTIGSLRPVPAEPLPLPELCLKGKVPPANATLNLDTSECPPELQVWPEFHNGVAAGLRLPIDTEKAKLGFKITRTWIVYNRPPVSRQSQSQESGDDDANPVQAQSYSHGGVLLALGLRGHLTALEMSDIYEYLTEGAVTTTVGVLIGLAANKRGTCDISVSKMICLHIPSLIPQHFSAIDVASAVQAAAVASAGLLYQRSYHRMMTEFLLNEIGKRPDTDVNTADREAYTLACGLALGTVNMCLGESAADSEKMAGLADLRIEERLLRYIIGGVDPEESRRTRESNDRFSIRSAENGSDSERCSTVYEGDLINTDLTAPGATLALGLMYLKTENKTIASALALPDTHFLLEFVRPDILGLRVIARSLILWNEVTPTNEWIEEQVPLVVQDAHKHLQSSYVRGLTEDKSNHDLDYDKRAVRQIYVHVVACACFGIGLRYAGTGHKEAKIALSLRLKELMELRDKPSPALAALRPELPILETCLGCVAISLALVLAGTGDLDALRLFRCLRWRCDGQSRYGIHMVLGMAVGLLFLGGGTCTVGREPEDIAALVTAFFPRFPITTADNQYHLQALRHIYALAVKERELRAVDIDTGESVYVPVVLKANDMSEPVRCQVPCLLPNSDDVFKELQVLSEKYYPIELDLLERGSTYSFFVKKRNLQLASQHDAVLLRHAGVQSSLDRPTAELVKSLTDNAFITAFADYICAPVGSTCRSTQLTSRDDGFIDWALLESVMADTEDSLFLYLSLRHGINSVGDSKQQASLPVFWLWNMRLIRTYCQERKRLLVGDECSSPLLDIHLLLPYLQEISDRLLTSTENIDRTEAYRYGLALYSRKS